MEGVSFKFLVVWDSTPSAILRSAVSHHQGVEDGFGFRFKVVFSACVKGLLRKSPNEVIGLFPMIRK